MARSTYIYLVYHVTGSLLSLHTVKHEAHTWVRQSGHTFTDCVLGRMRDGCRDRELESKKIDYIDWELHDTE